MMEREASLTFVSDSEDVARLLFSPLFICDGSIYATIGKAKIRGGSPQSVGRMLLRMYLVNIAQKRVVSL